MVLRLNERPTIEDVRNHRPETVEKLRRMLASGAPARPDPRRSDFYEVEGDREVFYIHISPINGKVLLLGVWRKTAEPAPVGCCASPQAA